MNMRSIWQVFEKAEWDMPAKISFKYNRQKTVEAILYLAQRIPDPSLLSISKLLYFADKTSLERYGRFITGDMYYAMENGPVPTQTYTLMKNAAQSKAGDFTLEGYAITPLREADQDEFSESDIECLELMLDLYGRVPNWKRIQDSHDGAWQQAWENRGSSASSPMSVESIIELLEDPAELLEFLTSRHDDQAA
jgi:uncharacterized phage-associated protein